MDASVEWSARTRRQEERLPMRGAACVIEPNDEMREHIASNLRAMGFTAHETGCGNLGEFIAAQVHLRVVVVDLALPDIAGLRLIRRLRRHDPGLIIIALSPDARSAVPVTLGRFAGADAVLASPASSEALCTTIADIEQGQRQRETPSPRWVPRLNLN
ncbi:MAG: response regulator [Caulobacteraceae bacterium]